MDARLSFQDVEGDYRNLEMKQYQEYERFLDCGWEGNLNTEIDQRTVPREIIQHDLQKRGEDFRRWGEFFGWGTAFSGLPTTGIDHATGKLCEFTERFPVDCLSLTPARLLVN